MTSRQEYSSNTVVLTPDPIDPHDPQLPIRIELYAMGEEVKSLTPPPDPSKKSHFRTLFIDKAREFKDSPED